MLVSPAIEEIQWGRVRACGRRFRDVKLFPGGARAWDWRETGTHHVPGIQPADVAELLSHGVEVIVLSQGVHSRLQVCPETLDGLRAEGVSVVVAPTPEAAERYNALCAEGAPVAALIHSTC